MQTIAALFASYRRNVLPATAPPIQVQECERAFYAGVAATITELQNSADDLGDDELERQVVGLMREVEVFAQSQGGNR